MVTLMKLIGTPECIKDIRQQLGDVMRNLYPMNADIPRSAWPAEVDRILTSRELPAEYKDSPIWQHAHGVAQLSQCVAPLTQ